MREGDGHVTLCATMIGLTERPIDISLTAVDGTAEGQSYDTLLHHLTSFNHMTS